MRSRALDPAVIVIVVLSLALGLQLAWTVTGLFGARDRGGLDGATSALPAPGLDPLDGIKAARFFGSAVGEPTAAASAAPPVSTQGLTLVGVLAESDPRTGRAIIGESGATARVYAVGATLPGGSRLAEVHADHVLLDRGGSFETLPLPRQVGIPSSSTLPAASSAVSPAALPAGAPSTEDITQVIRWQAVIRSDRPSGIRVYPGANAQRFAQLGLRPGDLVLAINDSPLADQANSEQFIRSLSGTPQARLTIERNGQTESLTLDLTSVAGGAPQALQRPGLN
jgi:general secretion pathway protein C